MPGSWNAPMSAPFDVGLMLLLTDGSVLAQDKGTCLWWRLRPDRAGRYAQGEWKATGASVNAPLYFASAVLVDGSVFVAGGEYSNNVPQPTDLCTAERYDPVAETWSALQTPPGWTAIGDAPCCVLPDGRVLVGNIMGAPCAIWDPVAGAWSATAPKLNGSSSEETWTLLPDGGVLTIDCAPAVPSQPGQPDNSELFRLDADPPASWIANGTTPAPLVEVSSSEIGPAILLPNGSVFCLGATGATALFAPSNDSTQPGVWTAGPNVPVGAGGALLGAKDAPACLLPNGRVLCAVGPVDGAKDSYAGPTSFFEFDPAGAGAAAWAALPTPPGGADLAPYTYLFLLLPTGQALVSNGTGSVQVFEPDGAADAAWVPTIKTCPSALKANSTYRLQGMQLGGLSQACSYGDDAGMATNYPIVRLRAAFPSDTVVYCRTGGHSTMAVATGRAVHHTDFTVPADIASGVYYLSVVANGAASDERPVCVASRDHRRRLGQAEPPDADPGPEGGAPENWEEQLFLRDLSEVHLLMDFISGRADKSLADLGNVCVYDIDGKPVASMPPQLVVEQICTITYPPEGTREANAHQAAFMLTVKDKLNFLAAPAKGLTIAFTSMFGGTALQFPRNIVYRTGQRILKLLGLTVTEARDVSKLFFSARAAYPNLEDSACRFRNFYMRQPGWAFAIIVFITVFNMDISVTGGVLQQIGSAESDYAKLFTADRSFVPTVDACGGVARDDPSQVPKTIACAAAKAALAQRDAGRDKLKSLIDRGIGPVAIVVRLFGPTDPSARPAHPAPAAPPEAARPAALPGPSAATPPKNVTAPPAAKASTAAPPSKGSAAATPSATQTPAPEIAPSPTSPGIAERSPLELFTLSVLAALNTIIIPTAFGWLGTLAGLMRSITAKVRDSVLAPRDYQLSRVAIFLGMSSGLVVGLFFNATDPGGAIAKNLGGAITVTAAGLAFLAGFAAEAFFSFLDTLVVRLWPANQPGPPGSPK